MNDNKKIELSDLKDVIDVEKLEREKPNIVIVAIRCEECGKIHPFIFVDEMLYFMTHYSSWHQYRKCDCGNEVSVYAGHGDIVYNPHNHKVIGVSE